MPVVSIPVLLLDPSVNAPIWTDVVVQSRRERDIFRELALWFPHLERKLVCDGGEPRGVLALFRERDGEDLRYLPDQLLDEEERLSLIYMVGC